MIAYILRSLAQAVMVMLAVALLAFSMFRFVGDPVANMVGQVAETLTGRTVHGLMPDHPRETALRWHVELAEAIAAGDAAAAREASDKIMRETISEMEPSWKNQPRVFLPLQRL